MQISSLKLGVTNQQLMKHCTPVPLNFAHLIVNLKHEIAPVDYIPFAFNTSYQFKTINILATCADVNIIYKDL